MIKRIILFIILNFGALVLGGLFTTSGISSDWYITLNKAPWTPPGWIFGFAWTLIMVCLSFYMSLSLNEKKSNLITLYALQLFLNVIWTPVFFCFHQAMIGLFCISLLTTLIAFMILKDFKKWRTLLLSPYLLWLLIATSLNFYIVIYN